ncbi:hypothetical protein QQF64_020043 [Cirrhinus molitorella]|uniref:Uncharacterized protein n=1 Tax=Cirrhinus molitorella TaxID=172907 RepID=A0ABR3LH65_9TELE
MEELVEVWDEVQTPWKCSTINREFWEQRSICVFHLVFGHERRALEGTGPNLESTKDSSEKSLSTLEIRGWGVSPFTASPTASTTGALMAEDGEVIKSTKAFKKLYDTKWSELVSHTALTTLNEGRFNKPSTLLFTEDVQRLYQHLENAVNSASESLKQMASPQVYGELCKATLAKIILFNRRRGGEVAKMQLKGLLERDTAPLHKDVAVGLTKFEQKLCAHSSRVEIRGKRGRKVAVLLSPDMVDALTLLIRRRTECGVPEGNEYLFARPSCLSPYRGQDRLRTFANECGAKNPELLRSTQLRKHVATLSQVLNLKNHELDQVADFLGHDIRVHREFYRLPEATTQLAKISKLLLAMEKGSLSNLQGKTLQDIEIEDKLDFSDSEHSEDSDTEEVQTQTETDIDPALGGPSQDKDCGKKDQDHSRREEHQQPGKKKARRQPVVNPPGTSDGMSIYLTMLAYPLRILASVTSQGIGNTEATLNGYLERNT